VTLRRLGFVEVPRGAKSGFDHADVLVTPAARRMYVAHTGADRVDVFDCRAMRYLHTLEGHPGVAGVLVDSERDLLLTTDRGCARLSIYRASDEMLLGQVAVGPRPNGVALDVHHGHAYTFDLGDPPGVGCVSTVVDIAALAVVGQIALPGRPRWALYDGASRSVYANISDPPSIVVIDTDGRKIARSIEIPSAGPHGLVLIDDGLFCATDAGELIVIMRGGRLRARLKLAGAPDVVMFDRGLQRLYVAMGSPGLVQSFDTAELRLVQTIETEEGAHTIGWDPELRRLWVFAPTSCGALVYEDVE
jgi:DNA-binding beta-propeller fold protein YncE